MITNRASTPLPIIQTAIPIVGFYVVAPLILLCIYFYFHFYLQKLWEELGSLPAVFTDGRLLHNRTDPWLLNDLVRAHFAKLKAGRPFLSYFQAWVSVLLAWWLVPVTLFLFWGRFLRRHDLSWTIFHALLLALAIVSAVRLYRIAGETLRGDERTVFRWKDVVKRRSTYLRLALAMTLGALLIAISLGAIFGERPRKTLTEVEARDTTPCLVQTRRFPGAWVSCVMKSLKYPPFLDLSNADVSTKPPNWTGKKDEELDLVKGASLQNSDLRNVSAFGAFLVKADLERSHMEGALLPGADLRKASMVDAHLNNAFLFGASLQDANLEYADLTQSLLALADLERADLKGADLANAELQDANLKYADLRTMRLFDFGRPESHSFPVKGLKPEMILKSANWQLAFFDPDMLKQLGLPPDHNDKLEKQMKAEQQAKAATASSADAKPIPTPDRSR